MGFQDKLNDFMAAGRGAWRDARTRLQSLLSGDNRALADNEALKAEVLFPLESVRDVNCACCCVFIRMRGCTPRHARCVVLYQVIMELPARIGDYTDFYSSREHATNVGIMFRGVDNALQPNWYARHILLHPLVVLVVCACSVVALLVCFCVEIPVKFFVYSYATSCTDCACVVQLVAVNRMLFHCCCSCDRVVRDCRGSGVMFAYVVITVVVR